MNIQESNKLIAEFMGWTFHPEERETELEYIENTWSPPNSKKIYVPHEWKFHKSWDWLMPVVDKIQEEYGDGEEHISIQPPNTCSLTPFRGALYKSFYGKTTKQATYEAVVAFIQWYNKELI